MTQRLFKKEQRVAEAVRHSVEIQEFLNVTQILRENNLGEFRDSIKYLYFDMEVSKSGFKSEFLQFLSDEVYQN